MTTRLTTERLTLRAPKPSDEAEYVAFYGSERRAATGPVLSVKEARDRFAGDCTHWRSKGFGRFVVVDRKSNALLGTVGPHHPDTYPEPEIAWHLWHKNVEGKGIAFEAACAARHHAFSTLRWDTAVSYIDPANTRSIALANRMGCKRDRSAKVPDLLGWDMAMVYRHPTPEALA